MISKANRVITILFAALIVSTILFAALIGTILFFGTNKKTNECAGETPPYSIHRNADNGVQSTFDDFISACAEGDKLELFHGVHVWCPDEK